MTNVFVILVVNEGTTRKLSIQKNLARNKGSNQDLARHEFYHNKISLSIGQSIVDDFLKR
jgi:hypothetical protein